MASHGTAYIPNVNPSSFVSTPTGWNACWTAAKAASGSTPAWLYWLGDSYMQGLVSTDFQNNSFRMISRQNILNQGYGLYGDFWSIGDSAAFLTHSASTYNGTPTFVVNNTTNASWIGWAIPPTLDYTAATSGTLVTFTSPYACTQMDIIYIANAVGTFTYAVDGGGAVTVNTAANATLVRVPITGLATTTHTLVLGSASAGNVLILCGVCTYSAGSGGTGIGFSQTAFAGASAMAFAAVNNTPAPISSIIEGREKSSGYVGGFGFPTQPHLLILALGINDCSTGAALGAYEHALTDLCQAARGGRANCSILIIGQSYPDGIHSDVTTILGVAGAQYDRYLRIQENVARKMNAAFVNVDAAWLDKGVSLGYQTASQQHPTNAGQAAIAAMLKGLL